MRSIAGLLAVPSGLWQATQCLSNTGCNSSAYFSGQEPIGPGVSFEGSRRAASGGVSTVGAVSRCSWQPMQESVWFGWT